jgi:hypothetical protein
MRLTALRQSRKEITKHPNNSRHTRMKAQTQTLLNLQSATKNPLFPLQAAPYAGTCTEYGITWPYLAPRNTHLLPLLKPVITPPKPPLRSHIPRAEHVDRAKRPKDRSARPGGGETTVTRRHALSLGRHPTPAAY